MSRFLYYLIIKPLSFFPLWILYYLSDFLFVMIYHVTGYRKSVVNQNLRNSFPDKSKQEIKEIEKAFFIHLCDMIAESIKLFSISLEELQSRFKIINTEILENYYQQGRSVILVGGHYNNWEIAAMCFDSITPHQAIGIYSPLSNKFFDNQLGRSRTKYGVKIIPKRLVAKTFIMNKDKLTMTIFGADQSPTYSRYVHWTTFLNQETAVHVGAERYAMKYNYPVVFIRIDKVKRGYYEGKLEVLNDNPKNAIAGEITELHTKTLEKIIIEKPQFWLWSHKRWKRKKTEEEIQAESNNKVSAA